MLADCKNKRHSSNGVDWKGMKHPNGNATPQKQLRTKDPSPHCQKGERLTVLTGTATHSCSSRNGWSDWKDVKHLWTSIRKEATCSNRITGVTRAFWKAQQVSGKGGDNEHPQQACGICLMLEIKGQGGLRCWHSIYLWYTLTEHTQNMFWVWNMERLRVKY